MFELLHIYSIFSAILCVCVLFNVFIKYIRKGPALSMTAEAHKDMGLCVTLQQRQSVSVSFQLNSLRVKGRFLSQQGRAYQSGSCISSKEGLEGFK